MQLFGRLLNRAILSHLLVAVPPAVVLGIMVISINEQALRQETQYLHMSLALQVRDAIRAHTEASASLLGHAERVLDLAELPIEQRQDMLRALIADGRLPHIALYRPDGGFDSIVKPADAPDVNRDGLPDDIRKLADAESWTVWSRADGAVVVYAWRRGSDLLGFVTTTVPQSELQALCTDIAVRFFGEGGRVDVIDHTGKPLLSSAGEPDVPAGKAAFSMVELSGASIEGGLTAVEAGLAGEFTNDAGQKQLGAIVSAPRLGWLVAASRPYSVAFASLERVRLRIILMSLIAALGAGVVGLLLAREVTGPVQKLIESVRRAAKRGFAPEAAVQATGELGQLANAFNHALAQMAEYRRQVRQTTQLRLRLTRLATGDMSARQLLARALTEEPGPLDQMTVLYADVELDKDASTSTEHVVAVLGEFFSAAHEAIRQEGGRVDRYSGDAVIGVFPASQVDGYTESAVAAARTIIADARAIAHRWQELSPIGLQAKIGAVTGQARLVMDDEDPSADPTVYGDIVEHAAALQRRATPGSVLLDRTTAQVIQANDGGLAPAPPPVSTDLPGGISDPPLQWTPSGSAPTAEVNLTTISVDAPE